MANDSDDDELPPLERDSVAPVHYSRRSLLALTAPEEPAAAKRPAQPSALAVAAAKRSLDAPKNGTSGGSEATTGASPKKEAALWQAADLTCRSTVKGVRRRKPRPRPPATLVKKERHACGYASAPDEPSNGTEQRRRSLEYQTPPATPVQYDSEDDFFSPKKFREPEDFENPVSSDDDGDRPRPKSSYVRSAATALEFVLAPKPALSEATQQQRAAVMAEKRRQHLARWPTRHQPNLVDTVTELREHFSGASRLDALRTKLTEEMKSRNMGIGDMFALVDDDKSLSLDASELHDMARRLNTNCRLQDAEQLVYERGERGEITIEAFVEWFHEAEDPLVKARNKRKRRCKTPSADLSKRRGYGVYGMGRAQAKHERAFDSYASQSINVDFNNATDGQLLQVDACLLDVDVRRIVEQFWRLADQDKTGTLEYEEYIELSLNLQKALCVRNAEAEDLRGNPDGFDEKQAREIAERDWDQDRRVDDNARKHRAMGVVDLRRFELSLLQLADAWADARTAVQVKKAAREAREAGRRVGPVCRNVAVATTLWNLLEAVSVVDDDDVRVWRWRFYREPLLKKKKAKPVAAPQKKSVVPAPVKKKTLNRAPLWLASHKKKKKVAESPIKSPPPPREWSPIAGLYTPPESPVKEKVVVKAVVVKKQQPRPKTPPPKIPTPPPTPPDPHVRELELMASLKPRAAYTERAEGEHCVYREAAQASPLKAQRLPRLQPTPTPHHSEGEVGAQLDRMYDAVVSPSKARADVGEANMLAVADAQKTYEAPAPAPAAPKTPVVAEAPARPRGRASKGMVFHRDVHAKGLTVSYDEDASFLALMRGAAAASPAPRRRKPPRKRRSRDKAPIVDPGLDAILRETAASPQKKPPRGSFDSNDSLASFVSTTTTRGRRSARLRTVV